MDMVYLDNNATTPAADEAIEAVRTVLTSCYGNPSSGHIIGQQANQAVERARRQIADLIGARPNQIIFTGGGTESDNIAIRGAVIARAGCKRIVTTAVEHPAVLDLCRHLARDGYDVVFVGVDSIGRLDLDQLADATDENTAVVSVMWANNETGVIFPIEQVAEITRARGVPLHVDAIQATGRIPIDLSVVGADLVSLSAHKMHGIKGTGALYVRRHGLIQPTVFGGHQEMGLRPGTLNVPGIVAFGVAAELAARSMHELGRIAAMRDRLEREICSRVAATCVNGQADNRLANTTNISFKSLEAEAILLSLSERGLCASAGSACSSGSLEASHVLEAMGLDRRVTHGAVRFSLSRYTTERDIDRALTIIPPVVERLAKLMAV